MDFRKLLRLCWRARKLLLIECAFCAVISVLSCVCRGGLLVHLDHVVNAYLLILFSSRSRCRCLRSRFYRWQFSLCCGLVLALLYLCSCGFRKTVASCRRFSYWSVHSLFHMLCARGVIRVCGSLLVYSTCYICLLSFSESVIMLSPCNTPSSTNLG